MCVSGQLHGLNTAGHSAPGTSVNAELCREIYDRLQTLGIKHNAKLSSACFNQTPSLPASLPHTVLPLL